MTMAPHLWPRDPAAVCRAFKTRHGAEPPSTFIWGTWTAAGTDYLEKLDARLPAGDGLIDISHVRWATANAITAIDLCAATMGYLFRGSQQGGRELSLRDFDPAAARSAKQQAAIARRRGSLPPAFLQWVDDTRADQRYIDLHRARNPFTHSWLQRHLFGGTDPPGPADRTQFTVRGTSLRMNARDMVIESASLALDRVRAFIEVVDQY